MADGPASWDLFAGVPPVLQVLFWVLFVLTTVAFLGLVSLLAAAAVGRARRTKRNVDGALHEDQLLWVFLVPALNEEVTIADSVGRLTAAQATHALVMVIDDGSTDRTPDILAALDEPKLRVLRRELPDAQRGKAAALNAAYLQLRDVVLREPAYAAWSTDRVIVGIIDADGRLDADAPEAVAWHFASPTLGGVQTLVRIYNRRGWHTWAQDVEFSAFGHVYQAGRSEWGTANMGGNGQFNRLSALESIDDGDGPWRDRLTEDQDLGVRLIQAGWRGAQENGASIHQQGLPSLRRLYRQRTRWAQGAWQALDLLPGVRKTQASFLGRADALLYLLTPLLQSLAGLVFLATIVLAVVYDVPVIPRSVFFLILFLALGLAPVFVTLLLRGRGWKDVWQAVVLLVPYAAYSWLIFPVLLAALIRQLSGRQSWAKTAREPIRAEGAEATGPWGGRDVLAP